ncbi:MAG: type III-B CRISPR module RAMP protein Cmr1, partial [Spirochaetia bacterium]
MEYYISRYKGIEEKTYDFEVITPMFVSGADQNKAELREQTLKGLLRFWWRATSGFTDVKKMKKAEDDLFGSTEKKSKVSLKIDSCNFTHNSMKKFGKFNYKGRPIHISDYLQYGVNISKPIMPGSTFTLSVKMSGNTGSVDNCFYQIDNALFALSIIGGIGSKSRNGFGSVNITNMKKSLKKYLYKNPVRNFFSVNERTTRYKTNKLYPTWEEAFAEIGLIYRDARLGLEPRHQFDERALLSKPIIAYKENVPKQYKSGRLAKPLFLSVSKKSNGFLGKIAISPCSLDKD